MFPDFLQHIGKPHEGWIPHSGRFPYGTGEKWENKPGEWVELALAREKFFRDNPDKMREYFEANPKLRWKDTDSIEVSVAKSFGMSTTDYRNYKTIRKQEQKLIDIRKAVMMKNDGKSVADISRELDLPWSTVKTYLKPDAEERASATRTIADGLLRELKEKKYLDVGEGVERQLGITSNQLSAALLMLKDDGYNVYTDIHVRQATNPDKKTTVTVLTDPDVTKNEVWENREQVVSPNGVRFEDYGTTLVSREPLKSIDSNRIYIRYAEDGGNNKDGVIELRPGVEDLTLGGRNYAQVRIAVDDTHYLKGMAVYGIDIPEGYDIVFNTNKHTDVEKLDVLKKLKEDDNNPFGSNTTQWSYMDSEGKKIQSPIEIVNDDTDWAKWQKSLPSQILSKQPINLAIRQLNLAYLEKEQEFNDILAIDNPTVRRQFLYEFSESCDRASVDLKAAALPRQSTKVLLPVLSLKDNEVYCPDYENGERVALFRFPHAGTFEIADCVVNNNNEEAKAILGTHPAHAIGVTTATTNKLSGADFDGDTALVIPLVGQNIKISEALEGLKNFDPKEQYRKSPDQPKTGEKDGFVKGRMMGDVTNLITDMTMIAASKEAANNANPNQARNSSNLLTDMTLNGTYDSKEFLSEIERAVRHSMVVIDAEKHNLDWKKSYEDNKIAELKIKYQGGVRKGAATLISRAGGEGSVPEREEVTILSKMTDEEKERYRNGEKIWRETGNTYIDKNGKEVKRLTKGDKLALTDDAYTLASPYLMDTVYAEHSNRLKALGNEARKEERAIGAAKVNKEATKVFEEEVKTLTAKLNEAALNAPLERQAQLIANKAVAIAIKRDPSLANKNDKDARDRLKKRRSREIESARALTGAKRRPISITEKEWNAIEAGAISDNMLLKILRYSDKKQVREYASKKAVPVISAAKLDMARSMLRGGKMNQSQVAEQLGVSVTTLKKYLNNFNGLGGVE